MVLLIQSLRLWETFQNRHAALGRQRESAATPSVSHFTTYAAPAASDFGQCLGARSGLELPVYLRGRAPDTQLETGAAGSNPPPPNGDQYRVGGPRTCS